jgi:hypothetical protein
LGDRKCLLVLDRADEIDDIIELLPSPVDCAVLVTTRQPPKALKHCRNISLSPIDSNSALELLTFLIGRDRVRNEYAYAQTIVEAASGIRADRKVVRPGQGRCKWRWPGGLADQGMMAGR